MPPCQRLQAGHVPVGDQAGAVAGAGLTDEDMVNPKIRDRELLLGAGHLLSHLDEIVRRARRPWSGPGGWPRGARGGAERLIASAGHRGGYILSARDLITNDIEVAVEGALLPWMFVRIPTVGGHPATPLTRRCNEDPSTPSPSQPALPRPHCPHPLPAPPRHTGRDRITGDRSLLPPGGSPQPSRQPRGTRPRGPGGSLRVKSPPSGVQRHAIMSAVTAVAADAGSLARNDAGYFPPRPSCMNEASPPYDVVRVVPSD